MAEFPAFPLWTDAYLADTDHLGDCEHGCYLRLLMAMWRAPNQRLPNDDAWLARKFRKSVAEVTTTIRPLIQEFCECDGIWVTQKRLLREWEFVSRAMRQRSDAAKSRWNKEKLCTAGMRTRTTPHMRSHVPTPTPTPTPTEEDIACKSKLVISPKLDDAPVSPKLGEALAIWQTELGSVLPTPRKLTEARRLTLKLRLADSFGNDLEAWRAHCNLIRSSPFLCGENAHAWRAGFDWALKPANIAKVMEGNYIERTGTNGADGHRADHAPGRADHDRPGTGSLVEAVARVSARRAGKIDLL